MSGSTRAYGARCLRGFAEFTRRSIRESDEQSLAQFAARLDISRQHLHQLESGSKRVSPERAMRFAQVLGYNELYFVQLALQDIVDDIGIHARVEVNVA